MGIYTESEASGFTLNRGKENKGSEGRESEDKNDKLFGGGPETHNYYCSYDGQGNVSQVSNMAGDMPYNLYVYDSYGSQTGDDYSNDSFSSYKGYDKGPFGYKTGVRQYDPETGRFLSPDAFKGYMTDPASQHPYMYCHGNPVRYSDPSGYLTKKEWEAIGGIGWGIAIIAGGILTTQMDGPEPGPADVGGILIIRQGTIITEEKILEAAITIGLGTLASQQAHMSKGKGPRNTGDSTERPSWSNNYVNENPPELGKSGEIKGGIDKYVRRAIRDHYKIKTDTKFTPTQNTEFSQIKKWLKRHWGLK